MTKPNFFQRFCGSFHDGSVVNRPMMWIAIAIAIAAACMSGHAKAAIPYPGTAAERFSVTVTGAGPDVILIPGLASSSATWDGTVAHLKGHYRLHVLNLAGFAGEPAGANATGDVLAPSVEAIDAYIKANHLDHPTIVGHSLGGTMTLMLAKAHPDDIGKIVLVDALPYVAVIFNPAATVPAVTPLAASMRDGMIAAAPDAFADQAAASTSRMVTSANNQKMVAGWSLASDRRVFAEAFYEDMVTDLRPDIAAMPMPATVIFPVDAAAGEDPAQTEGFYKQSYATMQHITFARIDNSLHFEMLDQPDAFNTALDAALK